VSAAPGDCPICRMALQPVKPGSGQSVTVAPETPELRSYQIARAFRRPIARQMAAPARLDGQARDAGRPRAADMGDAELPARLDDARLAEGGERHPQDVAADGELLAERPLGRQRDLRARARGDQVQEPIGDVVRQLSALQRPDGAERRRGAGTRAGRVGHERRVRRHPAEGTAGRGRAGPAGAAGVPSSGPPGAQPGTIAALPSLRGSAPAVTSPSASMAIAWAWPRSSLPAGTTATRGWRSASTSGPAGP